MDRRTDEGARVRLCVQGYLARMRQSDARVVPLTGDASDRRYFRVLPREGAAYVMAVHAQPFDPKALPFINVADLFTTMEVPVPAILGHAADLGVLALEDLGDVTLQANLGTATHEQYAAQYREAVGIIERIQRRGAELKSIKYLPYQIQFDSTKLMWELEFFFRHFLEGYRGATLSPAERTALTEEFTAIVEELAAEPTVLCHRDYHSRNLMVRDGNIFVIDFQDARMGPDTYDLVSLLRDSYVDLPERTVEELIADFLALRGGRDDATAFKARFDLMALQRNLKALGTFGYQTLARGNTVYIQYIPRTLAYAQINLTRHPRFARLHEILARNIDELR
ncbi:MAG: phosphotransferase [Acidobacteriota bacterium]|nr:phosphotransferase [Acidobacteriota bacterium]MDQ3168956.1 phosphotransferase [Acidobacteriota bacterium]